MELHYLITAEFLFKEYTTIIAGGILALSLASTFIRIMWEFR